MQLLKRVQDPEFSDWKTLRIDSVGEAQVIGEVYAARVHGGGQPLVVCRLGQQVLFAYWAQADGQLSALKNHLFLLSLFPPPIDATLKCLKTGRRVSYSRESWVEPL